MTSSMAVTFYFFHLLGLLFLICTMHKWDQWFAWLDAWQTKRAYDASVREAIRLRDLDKPHE